MKLNRIPVILVLLAAITAAGAEWPRDTGSRPYCQILDNPGDPLYRFRLGYVSESGVEDAGDTSLIEIEADWEFAYFRNILRGDVDCDLNLEMVFFMDAADIELPSQVAVLALDAGWAVRSRGGAALALRMQPGIYSDLEGFSGDVFSIPFSAALIHAFNPSLSGMLGVSVRPDFDRTLLPLVGVVWEVNDQLRLDARLPESRLEWYMTPDWSTHLGLDWRNMSYALDDSRDVLTLEDFRLAWGVTHRTADQLEVSAEVGTLFERSVTFDDVPPKEPDTFDMDSDLFVRFALGGPF
ncbi:MAG: hypothetical protein JW951_05915 [Lentisphaerae bacterium]|nr:hypothetical protein [Lentisphaerota bacterium]